MDARIDEDAADLAGRLREIASPPNRLTLESCAAGIRHAVVTEPGAGSRPAGGGYSSFRIHLAAIAGSH